MSTAEHHHLTALIVYCLFVCWQVLFSSTLDLWAIQPHVPGHERSVHSPDIGLNLDQSLVFLTMYICMYV